MVLSSISHILVSAAVLFRHLFNLYKDNIRILSFAYDLLVLDCPHVKIIRIPLDTVPAREEYCYHVAVEITSDLSDPATASEISNAIIGIEEDFERFAWMTF